MDRKLLYLLMIVLVPSFTLGVSIDYLNLTQDNTDDNAANLTIVFNGTDYIHNTSYWNSTNKTVILFVDFNLNGSRFYDQSPNNYNVSLYSINTPRMWWYNNSGFDGSGAISSQIDAFPLAGSNSTDNYVLTNWTSNPPTTGFTACALFYYNKEISTNSVIMSKSDPETNNRSWSLFVSNDNKATFLTSNDGSLILTNYARSNITLAAGNWYDVCGVYDPTYNKVYVNGMLTNNSDRGSDGLFSSSIPFTIGAFYNNGGQGNNVPNGTIDNVAVYNHILPPEQIMERYTAIFNNRSEKLILNTSLPGETWTANIFLYNTTNFTSNVSPSKYINAIPLAQDVRILPTPADADDNLTCNFTFYDGNGDNQTEVRYNWTINGVISSSHLQVLDANNTSSYDNITCYVQLADGRVNSSYYPSTTINLADLVAPTQSGFIIEQTQGYTDTAYYIISDCVDDSSSVSIGYPKVSYLDPDGILRGPYTMTYFRGDSYIYNNIFGVPGVNTQFTFQCMDAQSNLATDTSTLEFTSNNRPTNNEGAGAGGGGASPVTKPYCDVQVSDTTIKFSSLVTVSKLMVINNQNKTYSPSFSIDNSLYEVRGIKTLIQGNSEAEYSILKKHNRDKTSFSTPLVISSSDCKDLLVLVNHTNVTLATTAPRLAELEGSFMTTMISYVKILDYPVPFYVLTILSIILVAWLLRYSQTSTISKFISGTIIIVVVNVLFTYTLSPYSLRSVEGGETNMISEFISNWWGNMGEIAYQTTINNSSVIIYNYQITLFAGLALLIIAYFLKWLSWAIKIPAVMIILVGISSWLVNVM